MKGLLKSSDFEFNDSGLGRCVACHGQGQNHWTKLGHLRSHENQKIHIQNSQRRARDLERRTREDAVISEDGIHKDNHTAAILDEQGDDEWLYWPPYVDTQRVDNAPTGTPSESAVNEVHDIAHLITSTTSFSAGEEPEDLFAVTLAQAMQGISIDSLLPVDDEELPALLDEDELDDAEFEDSFDAQHTSPYTAQEISDSIAGVHTTYNEFFPYPNRGMMKTDILFSSPRLRFSRAQQEAVLAWAKDLGAREVPSLYALDKFQRESLEAAGNPTVKFRAASGNIFYMNSICSSLAKDYSHPDTRKLIHAYPEYTHGHISEVWHAQKWLYDAPDHLLTPMVRIGLEDFYVNELTHCIEDQWFIPKRFFDMKGLKWAMGHTVHLTDEGFVVSNNREARECSTFDMSYPRVFAQRRSLQFTAESRQHAEKMPNPDREIAAGLEWECPPIVVFIDDVSGNSTKQWNVHYSCYMSNGGLPRSAVEKEKHVRFVSTSSHASPMEIIEAVCADLLKSGGSNPIKTWDAVRQRYILLRPWLLFLPGDNPMQAELCSHIGLNANKFCRCCHVGGPNIFKESDEGYVTLIQPGRPRTVSETEASIWNQLSIATEASADKRLKEAISASGVKDSFTMPILNGLVNIGKIMRRSTDERHAFSVEHVNTHLRAELNKRRGTTIMNPLLHMEGFDVHKDTPVEPLHTHLLGVIKYFWAQTMWVLEKDGSFAKFRMQLSAVAKPGMNIPNIMAEYMCRYRGGLIGKHFKTISQIMPFAIRGLVTDDLLKAWLAVGRLTVLIWQTDIDNIDVFTQQLRSAIEDVLDMAMKLSPGLITTKSKLHIITHLPDHIIRFGPALLFSTERYESFNRVFRLCSIHSNRQAPSRDIAAAFANQERCRHMCTGGFWFDASSQKWVQASEAVLENIRQHDIDARLLGVYEAERSKPGTVTTSPSALEMLWKDTLSGGPGFALPEREGIWKQAQSVVALNGDRASVNNEVLVRAEEGVYSPLMFGSIVEILVSATNRRDCIVTVRMSTLQDELHSQLKMPVVNRTGPLRLFAAKDIACVLNVQHDCHNAQCTETEQYIRQEREITSKSYTTIQHDESSMFVVNMLSLHNQRFLLKAIPPRLRQWPALIVDRDQLRRGAAASLRDKKLQAKLARDAAVRKKAEKALAALTNSARPDTVIPDVEIESLTDERGEEAQMEEEERHEDDDALEPEAELIMLSSVLALRGPRRKAS